MRRAIYPGTFDPVTNGHLDLIARGARLFDRLTVAVAGNIAKSPVFSSDERVDLLKRALGDDFPTVDVCRFDGLIVDFAQAREALYLMRGLRTFSDFEYEFQMALTNRDLAPTVETVFVMPRHEYSYVSSRLIRESVKHGADVSHLIPDFVQDALRERLGSKGE